LNGDPYMLGLYNGMLLILTDDKSDYQPLRCIAQQPAQEPVSQFGSKELQSMILAKLSKPVKQEIWISVDEAKKTLKDGDLIYVVFENGKVEEAVYRFEQGFYPHRIISGYGNVRIEHCTNVMRRNPAPLPLPPVKEVTE